MQQPLFLEMSLILKVSGYYDLLLRFDFVNRKGIIEKACKWKRENGCDCEDCYG